MKYLFLIFCMACAGKQPTIIGTIDVIEGNWCLVEVENGGSQIHVQIDRNKFDNINEGDKIFLKVETHKINNRKR
tara:strand:- start:1525 stop:1749 length:225 start_codon:yes stop_codon:yes gene_type:complete